MQSTKNDTGRKCIPGCGPHRRFLNRFELNGALDAYVVFVVSYEMGDVEKKIKRRERKENGHSRVHLRSLNRAVEKHLRILSRSKKRSFYDDHSVQKKRNLSTLKPASKNSS